MDFDYTQEKTNETDSENLAQQNRQLPPYEESPDSQALKNTNYTYSQNSQQQIRRTNVFAIAGFILALVSLFLNFFGIMGILATVFSGIGLYKVEECKSGRGLGVAGLVIGIISIVYAFIILF